MTIARTPTGRARTTATRRSSASADANNKAASAIADKRLATNNKAASAADKRLATNTTTDATAEAVAEDTAEAVAEDTSEENAAEDPRGRDG